MNEWKTPESEIKRELTAGEQILWTGRPKTGIVFRLSDAFLIPFGLLWGGFAVFCEHGVIMSDAPFFFALFGIPLVLVGVYLIFGRFLVDAKQRGQTFYGVTSQRIVIISGILSRKVNSLNLPALNGVSLSEKRDYTGTITFGTANPMLLMWPGLLWPGLSWPGVPQVPLAFEMISHAKKVYEIIQEAQARE